MLSHNPPEKYFGFVIFVVFLIIAPSIQIMLSFVASLVTYAIIPAAIFVKIFDIHPRSIPWVRRLISTVFGVHIDNVDTIRLDLVLSDAETIGPYELPGRNSVTSNTGVEYRQRGSISTGSTESYDRSIESYDRLSDFSPHTSMTFPQPEKWSAEESTGPVSDNWQLATSTDDIDPKMAIPRTQPTEYMTEPGSATAPQLVDIPWGRENFWTPAVQEKLRMQSILYHQIHDLLSTHIENNAKEPQNTDTTQLPRQNIRVDRVNEDRIQQLKERYPDKKALHRHLDSFSSTMKKFAALTKHEENEAGNDDSMRKEYEHSTKQKERVSTDAQKRALYC